jgi:hypothetical protein
MLIVWFKRVYIKIPSIGEHIYRTVLGSAMLVMNVHDHIEHFFDTSKHCSIYALPNAWNFDVNFFDSYNRRTIGTQWDVFDVFHDGINHVIIGKMLIYCQILDASLLCIYQRHY